MRRPPREGDGQWVTRKQLPMELTGGERQHIGLLRDEADAISQAEVAVLDDLRFEHLGRKVGDAVWQFASKAYLDRHTNHVAAFVAQHAREPRTLSCFIPVEFLKVGADTVLLGIRLLPVDHADVSLVTGSFPLEPPVGCVAALKVKGTSYQRMAERARIVAAHALRVLRVALREHKLIHDRQLRFRLGIDYAFSERLSGWTQRGEVAWELELDGESVALALSQPVAKVAVRPATDIEKKAHLALQWMERASLVGEPLVALLYLFFALEALLGDKSEGLKAHGLAFRQTMLSHIVTGALYSHPNETYFLYDEVRSEAVHGEDGPEVRWDHVKSFARVVRRTLSQYLSYAESEGFKRRSRLLKALGEHPDREQLVAWLRQNGGPDWVSYLES